MTQVKPISLTRCACGLLVIGPLIFSRGQGGADVITESLWLLSSPLIAENTGTGTCKPSELVNSGD